MVQWGVYGKASKQYFSVNAKFIISERCPCSSVQSQTILTEWITGSLKGHRWTGIWLHVRQRRTCGIPTQPIWQCYKNSTGHTNTLQLLVFKGHRESAWHQRCLFFFAPWICWAKSGSSAGGFTCYSHGIAVPNWTVQAVPKASLTLGGENKKFDFERCVFGTFIPLSLWQR